MRIRYIDLIKLNPIVVKVDGLQGKLYRVGWVTIVILDGVKIPDDFAFKHDTMVGTDILKIGEEFVPKDPTLFREESERRNYV